MKYLAQAGWGQDDINRRGQSIDELLRDGHIAPRKRRLLGQVGAIKAFGEKHGLTATSNYTRYARLDRPAAVWVVSACAPLGFRPKSWNFPIVGSITYLGWFKLEDAKDAAATLRKEGWDVDVRTAGAYSTLGWFEDPVLSTMIPDGDEALGELANVVLHESLHATFYVNGQSVLNESVANFVGDTLTDEYLDQTVGASSPEKHAYDAGQIKSLERARQMHEAYGVLERLYASPAPDAAKLTAKAEVLTSLRQRLGFKRPINNATLGSFKTYSSGQKELATLLEACGGSFPRFLASLEPLKSITGAQRKDVSEMVAPLLASRCASR